MEERRKAEVFKGKREGRTEISRGIYREINREKNAVKVSKNNYHHCRDFKHKSNHNCKSFKMAFKSLKEIATEGEGKTEMKKDRDRREDNTRKLVKRKIESRGHKKK